MKTKIIAIVLACLLIAGLAACGGASQPSASVPEPAPSNAQPGSAEEAPVPAAATTELNILYMGAAQPNEKQFLNAEVFDTFKNATGVDVYVDYQATQDGLKVIESEQASGNVTFDLIYIDTANIPNYTKNGWVEDLTDLKSSLGLNITEMFSTTTTVDGRDYFIPITFDVYVTIANTKALEYLPEGADYTNLTWEQYADWAVNIAQGSGSGKTMFPASLEGSQLLYPMAGMGLSYGGGFPDVNSDGFKAGMELLVKMAQGDALFSDQANFTAPTDPLKNETVWLTFAHMGPVGVAYQSAPNKFVIGAAPIGSKGVGTTAGSWCYGIQKGAPNIENAKAFIAHVTSPEINYEICTGLGGYMSPVAEVQNLLGAEPGDEIMKAGAGILDTAIVTGVPASEYTDWNSVKLVYGDVFNKILNDKAMPDDAFFDEMQASIEDLRIK